MKFKLEFDMDGRAFGREWEREATRILKYLIQSFDKLKPFKDLLLCDLFGNIVGEAKVIGHYKINRGEDHGRACGRYYGGFQGPP